MLKTGFRTVAVLAVLIYGLGCHDKGNGPKEVCYRLFAGPSVGGGCTYVFDTETDSLVDSVCCDAGFGSPSGTRGAPYVAVYCRGNGCYRVFEAGGLSEVATNCNLNAVGFDTKHNLIVGFRVIYEGGPFLAEAVIADLNGGQILSQDTIITQSELDSAGIVTMVPEVIHPATGMAFGYAGITSDSGPFTLVGALFGYNYIEGRLHKIWQIEDDGPQGRFPLSITQYDIHPDGRRLYFVPRGGAELFCYDLDAETVLFRVPVPTPGDRLTPRVDPDGDNVYVLAQGGTYDPPFYRKVAVYNATDGTLVAEIPLDSTVLSESELPLFPCDMVFVPGTSKAYLASGLPNAGEKGVGKIIVVDTKSHAISKLLQPRFGFYGWTGQTWVLPAP